MRPPCDGPSEVTASPHQAEPDNNPCLGYVSLWIRTTVFDALLASSVWDLPRGTGAPTAFLDPSGDQLLVGASPDEQLCGLLLPGLVRGSLREADRQARDLSEQISVSRSQLGDAG